MTGLRVLALDISLTSTGFALGWTGEQHREKGTIRTKLDGVQRLQSIRNRVLELARGADLVVVEGYSFGSKNSRAHSTGELGGVLRLALHEAGIPVVEVPPKSRAKFAAGNGNAGKADVLVAAVKRLSYDGSDDNEADALWLLAMALDHLGHPLVTLPGHHRTALVAVDWSPANHLF